MSNYLLQSSLIESRFGQLQILTLFITLFWIMFNQTIKFYKSKLKLPKNFPNKLFIKRFFKIYNELNESFLFSEDD